MKEPEKLNKTHIGPFQIAALCGDDKLTYEIIAAQDAEYYGTGLTKRQRHLLGYED